MAAALFRAKLKAVRTDWQTWVIDSAGTWARDGSPAADYSCEVMARRGIDLYGHKSKTVDAALLNRFDLILVMEAGQKEGIQIEFPGVAGRVFMLSEMQGQGFPIKDPIGQPIEAYEVCVNSMSKIMDNGMERILSLVLARHPEVQG